MSTAALSPISRPSAGNALALRAPRSTDGMAIHRLIERCKPLDENSLYCNLLQASHFRDTSVVAEGPDGELLGFISGYLLPERDDTLFVWQVAVSADARGMGLGKKMLRKLVERNPDQAISFLHTTVTPDNDASWGMFKSFAKELDAPLETTVMFASDVHFRGEHDDEVLLQIGPFDTSEDDAASGKAGAR
jgi:L-2,4-diaminobutyric acid acetyltransferase